MKTTLINLFFILCLLAIINSTYAGIDIKEKKKACKGKDDGSVTVTISEGESPYKYILDGPSKKNGDSNGSELKIEGLKKGNYKLVVYDKKNCILYKEFEIEDCNLKVNIGSSGKPSKCGSNSTVVLTATASDGEAPYKYSWPGGVLAVSSGGHFTCSVTDKNECTDDESIDVIDVPVKCSRDPNEIDGPIGYGKQQFVSVNDNLQYTVRFENDPKAATGSAQKVVITLPIDQFLNMNSFQLADFGFCNKIFNIPSNRSYYSSRLDVRDSLGIYVDITTGIDVSKNEAFWIFESIDPTTGLSPADPNKGLLPINDKQLHNGEGYVSFFIKPKKNANTGDSINVKATIVFDKNEPLATNQWVNTVDAKPPVSSIVSSQITDKETIKLTWKGNDDAKGSGLKSWQLYYTENNSFLSLYADAIEDTCFTFRGNYGSSYQFYSRAKDNTGNEEELKKVFEQSATFGLISVAPCQKTHFCPGDTLFVHWHTKGIDQVNIDVSCNKGTDFIPLAKELFTSDSVYHWVIPFDIPAAEKAVLKVYNTLNPVLAALSDTFVIFSRPPVNAGIDTSICFGHNVQLLAAGSNSYEWFPKEGLTNSFINNPIAHPLTSTTYIVAGRNNWGCTYQDSVNIVVNDLPLQAYAGRTVTFCKPDSIELNAPGSLTYLWSPVTGLSNPFIQNPKSCPVTSTRYTVTLKNENGCINEDTVIVNPLSIPAAFLGNDTSICPGTMVTLNVKDTSLSCYWNNGNSSRTLIASVAGKYWVEVSNNYCQSTDTININYYTVPIVGLGADTILCSGSNTLLNAGKGYKNYNWNNGETTQTIRVNTTGTYFVKVKDSNGCDGYDTISLTFRNKPALSLGVDQTMRYDESIMLIPSPRIYRSYLWNDNSVGDSLKVVASYIGKGDHVFWVTATDVNNCPASDTILVTVLAPNGVPSVTADSTVIYLYPNPTSGGLNIRVENMAHPDLGIEIIDSRGVVLIRENYKNETKILIKQLDLSNLAPGMYLMKINYGNTIKIKSFIKSKSFVKESTK